MLDVDNLIMVLIKDYVSLMGTIYLCWMYLILPIWILLFY